MGLFSRRQRETPVEFTPVWVAEKLASGLAKQYSSAEFSHWFGNQTLAEGHTLNDALAAWYSLANLELVLAAWTAFNDGDKAGCVISLTRAALQKHWNMPKESFERMRAIVEKTEAFSVVAYSNCNSGTDLYRFFDRYFWMILGGPLISESTNQERTGSLDLPSEAALSGRFLELLAADKKFLVEWGALMAKERLSWWHTG